MKVWLLAAAVVLGPSGTVFHERDKGCADCGTVSSVEGHDMPKGKSIVMGHVVGRDAPTIDRNPGDYFKITVDMDRGQTRTINVPDADGLAMGSKVRVVDGNIEKVPEKVAE